MSQTTVNNEPDQAYEGKVHNSIEFPTNIVTGLADSDIYFGKAVSQDPADVSLPAVVHGYTAGELGVGVAIADPSIETKQGATGGLYADEDAVPVIRKGRIWVVTADAITNLLTQSVWVRSASPGGSPPLETLGSFRGSTAVDYTNLGVLIAVHWVGAATINGQNFGLLELNLP